MKSSPTLSLRTADSSQMTTALGRLDSSAFMFPAPRVRRWYVRRRVTMHIVNSMSETRAMIAKGTMNCTPGKTTLKQIWAIANVPVAIGRD